MIIDSHVHLKHGNVERTEYTPEQIVGYMDAAGVDRSVVFAMSTTTERSIEMAAKAAERYPGRLIPYVYALPSYERPVAELLAHALDDLGFRGMKIHAGECRLHPYIADPAFAVAHEYQAPVIVDLGGDISTATRLARDFPRAKLLMAHFGRYLCTDARLIESFITLAEEHDNVWLDASGVVLDWTIEQAVGRIGAERVLFGTDGPHPLPDQVRFIELAIRQIEMLDLTDEEKSLILGGNIARMLDLE